MPLLDHVSRQRVDVLVASAVTGVALAGLIVGRLVIRPAMYDLPIWVLVLAVLQGVVLVWRRDRPVEVLVSSSVMVLGLAAARHPIAGTAFGPLLATYAVGAFDARRWSTVAIVPFVALLSMAQVGLTVTTGPQADGTSRAMSTAMAYGIAFLIGRLVRSRRDVAAERTRIAVVEERARIARELHDVVAHHVSVMTLHAGAARRLLRGHPDDAEAALAQIEASGREALTAMPQLVGRLRDDEGDGHSTTSPQPTLADLEDLVSTMAAGGLRVSLAMEPDGASRRGSGDPRLPPAVEVSAYRIVQEALTNAARHAGAASVAVVVRQLPDVLQVEVVDDGLGPSAVDDGGFGLVGIRERVRSLGGTCEIGGGADGGFVVRASLPVTASALG